MISALLVFAQLSAPVLAPGVSPEFSREVFAVEKQLEAGDFVGATAALQNLPTNVVKVSWNDSEVPADQRQSFATARDQAFRLWKGTLPDLTFEVGPGGPLQFTFARESGTKLPDGTLTGMEWKIQRPKMDVTVGLTRGNPGAETSANNVHNDVARAIGHYLGVVNSQFPNTAMYPIHWTANKAILMTQDSDTAASNLKALATLRTAAAQSQKLTAAQPKLTLSATLHEAGEILQGDERKFTVQLKNEGNGPLKMWMKADCGCIVVEGVQTVAPGETRPLEVKFDFREYEGDTRKRVLLMTNDPSEPNRTIEIRAQVEPTYRFLMPEGPVAILGEGGGKATVYLTFKKADPFKIVRYDFNGITGTATVEPWSGKLADPQKGEGAVDRKGYKFTVALSGKLPPGRSPGTLMVMTDSPAFRTLMFTFQAQKGIVALPDELYWGELPGPKQAKFLVSRPGKPFKVLSVTSESTALKATAKEVSADEFAVDVAYDGTAPKGQWITALLVKTNDPKQPVVRVPVVANVK